MDLCSPSLTFSRNRSSLDEDDALPSGKRRCSRASTLAQRIEQVRDEDAQERKKKLKMVRATFPRASRAARASDPSHEATSKAQDILYSKLRNMKDSGMERAEKQTSSIRTGRSNGGGKGPNIVAVDASLQNKLNHLVSLKSKDLESTNIEPPFVLGGFVAPMLYDRLAEASLRSNAVNSSVTNRKKTEGAASQTPRISCKSIGQAAAAQIASVAIASAEARRQIRAGGTHVMNPVASNAVSVCALALGDLGQFDNDQVFAVTSTSRLVYNANPCKLSSVSVIQACTTIARGELDKHGISIVMGQSNHMLSTLCSAIIGDVPAVDAVWACWVLVTYLCAHPRGREVLRDSGLTDVDVQSALCFERYGSEEIRKRARQQRSKGGSTVKVLVQKRKRTRLTKGGAVSGASDAYLLLNFWHSALPCKDNNVLLTLASKKQSAAKDAALCTLARQSEESVVASNVVLKHVSEKNAVKSASALVSFVGRKVDQIPSIVCFRARCEDGVFRNVVGMSRIQHEAASTSIHACVFPPQNVRTRARGMAACWSFACKKLMPRSEDTATVSGVLERLKEASRLKQEGSVTSKRSAGIMENFASMESDLCIPTHATGTTRSFLSLVTRVPFNSSHAAAAKGLVDEANGLTTSCEGKGPSHDMFPSVIGISKDDSKRVEPICTPAPQIATAIAMSESLRRWMYGKSRKSDHCLKHLGFASSAELNKEVPPISSTEPLPLLTITDFDMEVVDEPSGGRARVAMGIHVCADGVVRVPEAVAAVMDTDTYNHEQALKARAALLVASSQASYIGSVGSSISCGYANASVSSSKKITVPDVTRLCMLSAMDCYVGGLNNLNHSFDSTPYCGVYGSRVCSGITMPGFFAHNYRSDRRQHGNCCLSEEMANELTPVFHDAHFVTRGNEYAPVPLCARGIPHNLTPGVHSCLDDYCNFIEDLREVSDRKEEDTCDSIMVLPFSAFSQMLRPDVESTVDASLRTCFRDPNLISANTGKAFLVDSTSEDEAIIKEPLFRRPSQVGISENPFGTCYENVDTFFNACNHIALIAHSACRAKNASATAQEILDHLHSLIDHFVNGMEEDCDSTDGSVSEDLVHNTEYMDAVWAADTLVLLNVLYPSSFEIGSTCLLEGISVAPPRVRQGGKAAVLSSIIDKEDLQEVQCFFGRFNRENHDVCAWRGGLLPLLDSILTNYGSHDIDDNTRLQFKANLETAVRAVWLVHSPDGVSRPPDASPLNDASCPADVCRVHIDPIFVGDEETGVEQRASPIGVKPHTYRQVLALLMGSAIEGIKVQACLNEGGLGLRVSSDATILDEDGDERTDKATSPVQTEGVAAAYGSHEDRIRNAISQRKAWDANAAFLTPVFTAVSWPRDIDARMRGEFGTADVLKRDAANRVQDSQLMQSSYVRARHAMERAAASTVPSRVNMCV